MSRIQTVKARQVFDSLGTPTVECEVTTADGVFAAIAPSAGSNGGVHEAVELRDGDKAKFGGKGVLKAVENAMGEIADAIVGMDPTDQEGIDQAMIDLDGGDDPTKKARLGANAVLAVSMAVCRAGAGKKGVPLYKHINALAGNPTVMLPVPCFNLINGGQHSANGLAMQEFCVMPTGAETFAEAMHIGIEVYQTLKRVVRKTFGPDATAVGDAGGFAPNIKDNEEALKLITEAIKAAGFEDHCQITLDVAASEFYSKEAGKYDLAFKRKGGPSSAGAVLKSTDELLRMYKLYAANYGVASIEDPFDRDDWATHAKMTNELGEVLQIVGDDLLSTNVERIETAIEHNSCNALLLKINQIGTVSEAITANNLARNAGMGVMVAHRLGDTEDTFIADLAAGMGTGQIKAGAPCRSERMAKYNQLVRIEDDLAEEAAYAGDYFRDPWLLERRATRKSRFDL
jgi:enolase